MSPLSSASGLLPAYTPVNIPQTSDNIPSFALDTPLASHRPSLNIHVDHPSSQQPHGHAPIPPSAFPIASSDELDIQMKGRKPAIAAAGTFLSLATFSQIYQKALFPHITPESERSEERSWVASSHSWLDRKVCDWFGLCGLAHLNKAAWTTSDSYQKQNTASYEHGGDDKIDLSEFWKTASAITNPKDWPDDELQAREVPQYVLEYAPLIHLYSGEEFWPCDIAEHLIHTTPHLNYTPLQATSDHPSLRNLDDLNRWGRFVYLQSDDNVEDRPEWLGGETNIPNVPEDPETELKWPENDDPVDEGPPTEEDGEKADWWNVGIGDTTDKGGIRPPPGVTTSPVDIPSNTPEGEEFVRKPDENWQPELNRRKLGKKILGGRSDAPAVLIVVEKDDGVVDAFWFFFYSYNLGNKVFNVRFGNHVGDWEHTVVRFQHGKPKAVFFSEHSFGEAYTYEALEKIGKRPVGYSATGTHAMYAVPGTHPYVLPGGILHDETDRGPLWDPLLNLYSYTYDYKSDYLRSSNLTPQAPIGWFYFMGHWGDKFYPLNDPRQYRFVGQYHYVNGPLGPRFKNLGRKEICQGNNECSLKRGLGSSRIRRPKRWTEEGEGEEMNEADVRRFVGPEKFADTET